jgi:hypothetical protein
MFSYLIGEAGSSVGTVIVRKTRARRDSAKNLQKIGSIKYASNKKGEGTVRLTIHQRA